MCTPNRVTSSNPCRDFRFRVYIDGIRRPTQAFFSLKNNSAYVECRHCLAYFRGSLSEDAEEEDDEERLTVSQHGLTKPSRETKRCRDPSGLIKISHGRDGINQGPS